jgi:uncharacterized repeat protein (TIGR01451 family)
MKPTNQPKTKTTMMNNSITGRVISMARQIGQAVLLMGAVWSMTPDSAYAQTVPEAGTLIGNQATATFQDAGGNTRIVTSNIVMTVVEQIAGVIAESDLAKQVSPGGQVQYPFTITNTGNGQDNFTLGTATAGAFSFTSVNIYADANADGIPDDFNPITVTPMIAAGGTFSVVVVANVPAGATSGQSATVTLTATSVFDTNESDPVVGTANVTNNAVINLTKSMSANEGPAGSGPYTVTITYTNTGNSTATSVLIRDVLPTGMTYVAGTGRWSVSGASALTDGTSPAEPNPAIAYDFNVGAAGAVSATISSVAPGQSGFLTFNVNIAPGTPAGALNNVATTTYNDGAGNVGPFDSNTFVFTVTPSYGVSGTGDTIANANQGATIAFDNVVTNTGTVTDAFNITLTGSTFPGGTSFILYKSDGVSPLLDTNGDGLPDTGPVAAGATYTVVLKATLPNSISGGPYSVDKIATSIGDPTKTATMPDVLTAVTANTIDLTVDDILGGPSVLADGAGPEGSPVKTNAVNPGATTRFELYVNNTSTVSDNFDLAASTVSNFASITLPTGVTVTFRDASENVIANTGTILAGGNKLVYMDVTVPPDAAATISAQSLFVRAISPTTSASDRAHLGYTVNTVRNMVISPNNSGQVFPGGTVTYTHTVTNLGNVAENSGPSSFAFSLADNTAGFSSVAYLDLDEDGEIDPTDPPISAGSVLGAFAPGQSKKIIVKITSTAGVEEGDNNTTTVTITISGAVNSVPAPAAATATDITTVINSNVALVKRQAKDADNNGVADAAYGTAQISAKPGEGVMYQITVQNLGTTSITSVEINDAIPPYTTYNQTSAAITTSKGTATFNNTTKTLTVTVGALAPGESAVITFGVTIDN